MSLLRNVRDRFRRDPGESAVLAGLVVGAVALLALAGRLPLSFQVLLWGLLLAGLVLAGRLFGPVLYYDLVRSARRLRFVVVRTLYAALIAFILCWLFSVIVVGRGWRMPTQRMSEFATSFLYTFLFIQFATVMLLTPAYTAGAVAEEKERKTLEFILATDLENREIVLGKLTSRLLNLSLLILAGVPILSFLQFLGGIDFAVVLAGLAATAATMFSLGGLGLLNSVRCRRLRDAIVLTYLMTFGYYLIASGSLMVYPLSSPNMIPGLARFPSTDTWTSPVELSDLVDWLNAGNIAVAVYKLGRGSGATTVLEEELPGVLGRYVGFHALVGSACLAWAVLRLRVVALTENVRRSARPKRGVKQRAASRPPIGRHPMIWKEVYAEGGLQLNALGRVIVAGVLVLGSFLPAAILLWLYFDPTDSNFSRYSWRYVTEGMNAAQMRFVGTTVATLMLLAVAVRAAGSVRSEHERHTFDELMTTRLSNGEILFGKWLGAVLSVRWGWAWLGLIWFVCLVTGGVQIYALPLILVSWVTYAAGVAGVGLWFSIGARSTLRATVATLAAVLFLFGGHWLVTGLFCYFPMALLSSRPGADFEWMRYLQAGQTPPFVMGLFGYSGREFEHAYGTREVVRLTLASVFGVLCWMALLPVLWLLVKRRFEEVTGRTAESRPERRAPRGSRLPPPKRALLIDAEPAANEDGNGEVLTGRPADEEKTEDKGQSV